jgi:Na+-translocating ferredoxin:NAD+ oxidoreductase subunit C
MNRYSFLLKQHIGAPAIAIVKAGDRVKRGALIAVKAPDAMGCNIHSSVSGKVTCVTSDAIEIVQENETEAKEYVKLKAETPLGLIEEAGIVGLGGAGFPTYIKLSKPLQQGGIVILNAVECEPILRHNIFMVEKKAREVIRGLQIVMEIVHADRGRIAIKEKHKEATDALKICIAGNHTGIGVCLLPDLYPMGEERALIREVQGMLLNIDQLPMEANAVVINAETAYRIFEAVEERKPFIDKDITVAGKLKGELIQVFEDVPIGTKVGSLIERAGGCSGEYGELIMGGPFTGKRTTMDSPVVKTTGGILVTETFLKGPQKIGLLVCACGADKERLLQISQDMGSEVAGIEYCKQAQHIKQAYKCENPGKCPGQVQKVLALKKAGAQALLISNCSDCTNTVMSCAPQLKLPVYHCTDGALRSVNHKLVRRLK